MVSNMETHYVCNSLFEDNITQVSCDVHNAEDYAEMRVTLGAHFPVLVQFKGDQEASC